MLWHLLLVTGMTEQYGDILPMLCNSLDSVLCACMCSAEAAKVSGDQCKYCLGWSKGWSKGGSNVLQQGLGSVTPCEVHRSDRLQTSVRMKGRQAFMSQSFSISPAT